MRSKYYIYTVSLKANGHVVYEGNVHQVCDFLGVQVSTLSGWVNGKHSSPTYRVTRRAVTKEEAESISDEPDLKTSEKSEDEKIYDSVVLHLKLYGNTVLCKRKNYVLNRLAEEGIEVTIEKGMYGGYLVLKLKEKKNEELRND